MGRKPPSERDARPGTTTKGAKPAAEGEAGAATALETAATVENTRPLTAGERNELRVAELERLLAAARRRRQKTHVPFTDAVKLDFLDALEVFFEYLAAADHVGVNDRTVRTHRDRDKAFQAECDLARQRYRNRVSAEVHRRAVVGWDKPVYQGGIRVGFTEEHSDRMLELLAKRHIPEFRDKVDVEHSGEVGITTGVLVIPVGAAGATPALRKVMQPQIDASAAATDDGGEQ